MSTAVEQRTLSACRGVSVHYGSGEARVDALAAIDLEIGPAETLALRGPSGSGKTTLLHLLGGLLLPSAGEVIWKGRSLALLDAAARGEARAAGYRLRLPGLEPAAQLHRARERRLHRLARRPRRAPGRARPRGAAGAGRPRRQGRRPARRALRRRGPASGDGAGARPRPRAAPLRRADRPPRLRHRRRGCSTCSGRCRSASASPSSSPPMTPTSRRAATARSISPTGAWSGRDDERRAAARPRPPAPPARAERDPGAWCSRSPSPCWGR